MPAPPSKVEETEVNRVREDGWFGILERKIPSEKPVEMHTG